MLITVIVGILLTLIFGKITIKEIKEHVRKYTNGDRGNSTGGSNSAGGEEGKLEKGKEGEGEDCGAGK
jgi:hypothetical protein